MWAPTLVIFVLGVVVPGAIAALAFRQGDWISGGVVGFLPAFALYQLYDLWRLHRRLQRELEVNRVFDEFASFLVARRPGQAAPPYARPWTEAAVLLAKAVLDGGDPEAVWPLIDELLEHRK